MNSTVIWLSNRSSTTQPPVVSTCCSERIVPVQRKLLKSGLPGVYSMILTMNLIAKQDFRLIKARIEIDKDLFIIKTAS